LGREKSGLHEAELGKRETRRPHAEPNDSLTSTDEPVDRFDVTV
jgi:hypothetical protein